MNLLKYQALFFQGDKYRLKNDHSHPAPQRRQLDDAKKLVTTGPVFVLLSIYGCPLTICMFTKHETHILSLT